MTYQIRITKFSLLFFLDGENRRVVPPFWLDCSVELLDCDPGADPNWPLHGNSLWDKFIIIFLINLLFFYWPWLKIFNERLIKILSPFYMDKLPSILQCKSSEGIFYTFRQLLITSIERTIRWSIRISFYSTFGN